MWKDLPYHVALDAGSGASAKPPSSAQGRAFAQNPGDQLDQAFRTDGCFPFGTMRACNVRGAAATHARTRSNVPAGASARAALAVALHPAKMCRGCCADGNEVPDVEALLLLPWRAWLAVLLALMGVMLLARGVRALRAAQRKSCDPERALAVARSLRTGIAGFCLAVLGIGWLAGAAWLVLVALIVLGEEMLETSVMVAALEDGRRRSRTHSA